MTQVVFSVAAEKDLEEIGDFVAADNPRRAVSFIREILELCTKIGTAPLGYVARPELGENLRSCSHGRYLIIFQPTDDEILIVRVLHGARNIVALFTDIS